MKIVARGAILAVLLRIKDRVVKRSIPHDSGARYSCKYKDRFERFQIVAAIRHK